MKRTFLIIALFGFFAMGLQAQTKDIPVSECPADVVTLLNKYIEILQNATSVEDAAEKCKAIFAGHLLNSSGNVDSDVLNYSLKKDFGNAKFYQYPVKITRISRTLNEYDGFQSTLFEGTKYKIWIAKKEGVAGMPAPTPIIKPAQGDAKIVSVIGSL
jgi:hypothetical protein